MVDGSLVAAALFNGIAILMIIVSLIMYFPSRERRLLHMLMLWVSNAVWSGVSFLTLNLSENWIGVSGMLQAIVAWSLMRVVEDVAQKPLIPKHSGRIIIGAIAVGVGIGLIPDVPFWLYTGIPVWLTNCFAFYVLIQCIREVPKDRTTPLHYFFYFSVLLVSLHQIDYPITRLIPGIEVFGFGVACFYSILLAAVMPGMIVQDLQAERSKILELVLKERNIQLEKQSKMSSLGEMTASLVHELSNPLSLLLTRIALLLRHQEKDLLTPENLKTGLRQMEATIHRMMKITQSLRAFSRDSGGDKKHRVTLQSIIDETLSFSNERFIMGNTPLLVGAVPNVNLQCRSVQISQILINLLNNAFDAVNGLQNRWVRLDFEVMELELKIMVTDSGNGVPEAIKAKIMEPFFTTKEVGKGTGLGLSISKGIAEEHGGRLYLEQELLNTCFILELPITK